MKKVKIGLIMSVFLCICICFLSSSSPAQTGAEEDYPVAVKLYNDGIFDLAAQQFQNFIEKYPDAENCDQAQYWMGMSFWQTEKYPQATKTFEAFLKNYPKSKFLYKGI